MSIFEKVLRSAVADVESKKPDAAEAGKSSLTDTLGEGLVSDYAAPGSIGKTLADLAPSFGVAGVRDAVAQVAPVAPHPMWSGVPWAAKKKADLESFAKPNALAKLGNTTKPDAKKDEATKEATKDATKDEATKDEAKKDEATKDEATKDEAKKDEATKDEAKKDDGSAKDGKGPRLARGSVAEIAKTPAAKTTEKPGADIPSLATPNQGMQTSFIEVRKPDTQRALGVRLGNRSGGLGLRSWLDAIDFESDGEISETPAIDVRARQVSIDTGALASLATLAQPTPAKKTGTQTPAQPGKKAAAVTPAQAKPTPVRIIAGTQKTPELTTKAVSTDTPQLPEVPTSKDTKDSTQRRFGRVLRHNQKSSRAPQQQVAKTSLQQGTKLTQQAPRALDIAPRPALSLVPAPSLRQLQIQAPVGKKKPAPTPAPAIVPSSPSTKKLPTKDEPAQPALETKSPDALPTDKPATTTGTTTATTNLEALTAKEDKTVDNSLQAVKDAPLAEKQKVASEEERKVETSSKSAQQKVQKDANKTAGKEATKRRNATRKGKAANTKAAKHTQNKRKGVQQSAASARTSLRKQFEAFKTSQQNRLLGLLANEKTNLQLHFNNERQRQLDELDKARQAIVDAKDAERKGLVSRIAQDKQTENNNYTKGVNERNTLKAQVYAEHARIRREAVSDANRLCTEGCTDFFTTGERLANEAMNRANSDANALLAKAKGAEPSEQGSLKKQASERRAQGRKEAASIRADYKAKADKLEADTKTVIKSHETTEQTENKLEDARALVDIANLEKIRVLAHENFDKALTSFDQQFTLELAAYDDYMQTQKAVIEKDVSIAHQAAVADLEDDYKTKIEGVTKEVNDKIAGFETKLNDTTQQDLAALAKEYNVMAADIEKSIGTITTRSTQRAQTYTVTANERIAKIGERKQGALTAIKNEAKIANDSLDSHKRLAQTQRTTLMGDARSAAQRSYERQHATGLKLNQNTLQSENTDRATIAENNVGFDKLIENANRLEESNKRFTVNGDNVVAEVDMSSRKARESELFKEKSENAITRRELKIGRERVTDENAVTTRTEVLTLLEPSGMEAINQLSNPDPGKALSILGTLTQEELLKLYPPGSEAREQLLKSAYKNGISNELKAMLGDSGENGRYNKSRDPRAIALTWALENGDKRAADAIFNSLTTDKERAEFEQQYSKVTGKSIRDSFTSDKLDDKAKKELTTLWEAGRSFDGNSYSRSNDSGDLTEQWNREKATREAIETVSTYSSTDKNKLVQLRSEMYKRHAGPYLSADDEARHKAELRKELEQFDSTVFNMSGRTMESMDTEYSAGKVQEALLATSKRQVVDPYEPDFTTPQGDWDKFGVALLERSIEKNDYDTRLNEGFLAKLPADKRRMFLDKYKEQTGRNYVDDVNANVRTSRAKQSEQPEISYRKAKTGDVNDLGSTTEKPPFVPASEIDADSLISIAENGKVPDALRLVQLKNGRGRGDETDQKEYANKINQITAQNGGFDKVSADYVELNKKYKLGTTGDGREDLKRDVSELLKPRDERAALFDIDRANHKRTPELYFDRNREIYTNDSWMPDGIRRVLEGPAGEELERAKKQSERDIEQLRKDGLSTLTQEEIEQRMRDQDPPPFTKEQLERYGKFKDRNTALVAANETVATNYETNVSTVAQIAATGVIVVATVALTGPLGPVLAGILAPAAGGLTTLAIKQMTLGKDYSWKELKKDADGIIVDALIGGIVGGGVLTKFANKIVGRFGPTWAKQLLAEAIQSTTAATSGELAKALLDPDTFVGNEAQIREKLMSRLKKAAGSSLITTAVKTPLTNKAVKSAGVADATFLPRTVKVAIESTSNVAGIAPWAKTPADVFNAAIQGLGAATKAAPDAPNTDTRLATTKPSKARQETLDTGAKINVKTKAQEVQTLRALFKEGALVKPRNSVDANGRRVYDVTLASGETFVLRGPSEVNRVVPKPTKPSMVKRESTDLVPTKSNGALMVRPSTDLVPAARTRNLGGAIERTDSVDTTTTTTAAPGTNQPVQIAPLWRKATNDGLSTEAIATIQQRFEKMGAAAKDPMNQRMMERLRKIAAGEIRGNEWDRRYFLHEKVEGELMAQGIPYQRAHLIAIEQLGFGDHPFGLYAVDSGVAVPSSDRKNREVPKNTSEANHAANAYVWKPLGGEDYTNPDQRGAGVGDDYRELGGAIEKDEE